MVFLYRASAREGMPRAKNCGVVSGPGYWALREDHEPPKPHAKSLDPAWIGRSGVGRHLRLRTLLSVRQLGFRPVLAAAPRSGGHPDSQSAPARRERAAGP